MTNYISFKSLQRPPKPNTCLAAPKDHCLAAEPDFAPPDFSMTGRGLFSKLSEIIAAERSFGKVESDAEALRLKFVATTGFMRFKDDVDVEIIPLDDSTSTLAIYSRSRIGYSDLGANQKRVKKLIGALTTN
ncbi:MAG: DUF1499 domain-containing protein [Pseudomonadota bacterium]